MKKVLFVGDAACQSGFARCTHAAAGVYHAEGWDVRVIGVNYRGEPHDYPYNIYPAFNNHAGGNDMYGLGRLKSMAVEFEPDLVIILTDPWNVKGYTSMLKQAEYTGKTVGWLAVDAKNQRGFELDDLDHIVCWTEFGRTELIAGGAPGDPSVIPLGFDRDVFFTVDKYKARASALPMISNDDFLVGYVGRNQTRKRLDLLIEYFGRWVTGRKIENAYLYLHVAPTGDKAFGLSDLVIYHGLRGRVLISNQDIGSGIDDVSMNLIYNSLDLYMTTTQGEGWGLPIMEAMACGVPVLAPRWSGIADWAKDAACLVPCDSTIASAPEGVGAYTLGGLPARGPMIEMLDGFYHDENYCKRYSLRSLRLTSDSKFDWDNIGKAFYDEVNKRCQL